MNVEVIVTTRVGMWWVVSTCRFISILIHPRQGKEDIMEEGKRGREEERKELRERRFTQPDFRVPLQYL